MKQLLTVLSFATLVVMSLIDFPDGSVAALITGFFLLIIVFIIQKAFKDSANLDFIINIFLIAFLLRIAFGIIVHVGDLRSFTAPDSRYYDNISSYLSDYWLGLVDDKSLRIATAWGLQYVVAVIYSVIGKNILAVQSLCGLIGAATVPLVYACSKQLYENVRVAKYASIGVAVFPAFVIWSAQLLKDGPILFFLVLTMLVVMQLQRKFSYAVLGLLIFSFIGVFSLRFYIFYMLAMAVIGSFVIGIGEKKSQSLFVRLVMLTVIGIFLTYFGILDRAVNKFETYGSLERIQRSRSDLSRSDRGSSFGGDLDVSTTSGAVTALPIGFSYLMFAPFPWEVNNFRQAITLPEVLLWWCLIPFVIIGTWYSVKYKFRHVLPLVVFSSMLTLAYSIFQGNVGTAYRHRTQIQVFLFIFAGVGITYILEKRENKKLQKRNKREHLEKVLRGRTALQ